MPHPKTRSCLSVLYAPLLLGEVGLAGVVYMSFVPRFRQSLRKKVNAGVLKISLSRRSTKLYRDCGDYATGFGLLRRI